MIWLNKINGNSHNAIVIPAITWDVILRIFI